MLQGLRVAFVDKASDVALLELLDDIPPAYNATLAGTLPPCCWCAGRLSGGPSWDRPARSPRQQLQASRDISGWGHESIIPRSPAGWDVRDTPLPFNFVDISQVLGRCWGGGNTSSSGRCWLGAWRAVCPAELFSPAVPCCALPACAAACG